MVSIMADFSLDAHSFTGLFGFFTRTPARSASLIVAIVTSISVSCAGYVYVLVKQERTLATAKRAEDHTDTALLIGLIRLQKQIQIDIVKVQQYLSDFSATRGLDGHDDGLTNAQLFAAQFAQDIEAAKKEAKAFGSPDLVDVFSGVERRFPKYYADGVEMARVYAAQGASAGNKLKVGFDKISDDMQMQLRLTDTSLDVARQRHAAETAVANRKFDELRENTLVGPLAGGIIAAIISLLGTIAVRKWLIAYRLVKERREAAARRG